MDCRKKRYLSGLVILLTVFANSPVPAARADINKPEAQYAVCDNLQPPAGNRLAFRVYALGVQIYRWNGTSWDFVEPVAKLYADPAYHAKVGIHYAGPTWESITGDKVVATKLQSCTQDPSAIPWLLLEVVSREGSGVLSTVTYIQRVNTKGGLAPTAPGSSVGAVAEVPYAAEYYFYRARN